MQPNGVGILTTREVADILGEPVEQIIRLVKRGDLPSAQKLAGARGAYLFDPDVVKAFAEKTAQEAENRARGIREALEERAS